jgi:DNA-binding response OmpR family regulator
LLLRRPEALDLFRQRREEIGLVLLDVLMPGLSGDETARVLRRLDPEVKILLSSGCTADAIADRVSGLRTEGFLQKPYRAQELVAKVRCALGVDAA